MTGLETLAAIVRANRNGTAVGIPSYCTAHPDTLRAVFRSYAGGGEPILVEATCNQVNQFGGYTAMTPAGFRNFIEIIAAGEGVDPARIILGGDHLGPNPWKAEPAAAAMAKAKIMVRAYVEAGFGKLHLDASMACSDDAELDAPTMAERAAELCAVAEASAGGRPLCYIIGTEVPIPGGETAARDALAVTRPEAAEQTFALHERSFMARGLGDAFRRVIGIVVQPGVDFGNAQILAFDPPQAAALSQGIARLPDAVFEAHSTDYQSAATLKALVAGHFAILKVGPELTFAFREAVVAMAAMENHLSVARASGILAVIDAEMLADPKHWRKYIIAGPREPAMRLFGLSDRVRYYWPKPAIAAALRLLFHNIDHGRPERGLLSQFAPEMLADAAEPGSLSFRIVRHHVGAVIEKYRAATRPHDLTQREGK